ncbi:AraC family transcriptional regulator [Streptomyces sp. FH025]|uniref:AraC family transcriptional regulator n=1 Tax=Streptomyces sp. FH025 TaxID=2815937 RepID=UPI0027DC0094|nr:AraC family transcriptional regulator [Streptomyces sp. FH025]
MLLYGGDSVEQLHRAVSERFAPHQLTVLGDQRLNARFSCIHEGAVSLYELGYGADVRVHPGELPDFYNIQLPVSGTGTVTVNGAPLPPEPSVIGPGASVSMTWNAAAFNRILVIPSRSLELDLEARLGDSPGTPPRFNPVLDSRNPAVRAWLELARAFHDFAVSPLAPRSPLALGHFERLLIDGLLDAQPHTRSDALSGRGPTPLSTAVRRAAAFCEEHAHEAISVADIARGARVSLHSLRAGFRGQLNTTPLAFLRRVRLDNAHRDLLAVAEGRSSDTVTDIACRWGFTHLGRFSAHYREAYGRPPSETLRRAS